MCEEKTAAKREIDRLIEAMDRLCTALWWERADPCQLNIRRHNETSLPAASGCALAPVNAHGGSATAVADL